MMEFVRYRPGIEAPDRNFDSALQVVLADIPAEYAQGICAKPGRHEAIVRSTG